MAFDYRYEIAQGTSYRAALVEPEVVGAVAEGLFFVGVGKAFMDKGEAGYDIYQIQ